MNISKFSVYHPIFTVMIMLIVILLGAIVMQALKKWRN